MPNTSGHQATAMPLLAPCFVGCALRTNVVRAATSGAVPYVAFIGAALLVGALILYRLLRRHVFLRLQQITVGIRRIRDGDFQAPITIKRDDELGQIADALNEMSDQRGQYEQRLHQERNLYRTLSETNQLILRQEAPQTLFEDICSYCDQQYGSDSGGNPCLA